MLVGAGARGAAPLLIEMATLLGTGVAKALLGKDVLPDDLPFVIGAIGLLGTEPSWDLMRGCDPLLMVGTGFPWSEFLPKDGAARAVQIDIEASMLSLRYPTEVNLHGDATATLAALLPLILRKENREWSKTIESNMAAWWEKLEGRAKADANPVNPRRVIWEMSPLLPANAIVTSDSGSCANWYARDYRVQQDQSSSLSGGLASMGAAVPYAIGAKFAHPDRPVIALVGDGAMQMDNMAELITVQKYWKRWADPRWIVCVLNNQDLNEVTWEQRVMGATRNSRLRRTSPISPTPSSERCAQGSPLLHVGDGQGRQGGGPRHRRHRTTSRGRVVRQKGLNIAREMPLAAISLAGDLSRKIPLPTKHGSAVQGGRCGAFRSHVGFERRPVGSAF